MAIIDNYLREMLQRKGSDLHLAIGKAPKIRIHGELHELDIPPLTPEAMTEALKPICPDHRWAHYLQHHDLDFAYEIAGLARFRANYLYNYNGMGAVLRQIPSKILTMQDLKMPEVFQRVCQIPTGLILVTGPTGSGKSTTLAAMIDYINATMARHIITVEDPVEFVHQNKKSVIVHREIGEHADSFADALRGAKRADPDILLVGEMRELETIRLALGCASMGMLVFGTLHTNNAPKTIDRIIDVFPADEQGQIRTMLAESISAIISQLLCRTADGKGRMAVHEILLRTESLPNTIREGQISAIRSIIENSGNTGMCSMDSGLRKLLAENRITPLEAYMKASDKKEFQAYLTELTILK